MMKKKDGQMMEFNQEQSGMIFQTLGCPDCGATKSDFDMIEVA